ncbi:aminoglycoside phosphotransferase family protein [Pullulanibacillus sp. KACC 23026]|uniref:phosphotransferase family protein n=1 Tax=Pullulanibacillus sp. KACC 23026 TaxID=3028315 RepID=UPI0023B03641|nr:aminoglycoside phosphotransferase family protein [Pullulanibacillus sp. KACC 23026]WEG12932.1 aminoglycoside phosphotransferase family protein [Pullulanibacillus sp. KACC 23026]
MGNIMECVLPEGYLNENSLFRCETLYVGTNGRKVERFFLTPTESYIFKPLTNPSQFGKERWIYEQVLPDLKVPAPKIVAASQSDKPEHSWIIFEDMGALTHQFEEKSVLQMAKTIAHWHAFPIDHLKVSGLLGPKPPIAEMIETLLAEKRNRLNSSSFKPYQSVIAKVFKHLNDSLSQELVFSHGDLHLGNYAASGNRVVVLDWEHAHLNMRYWDLYHLLDLSHPLFPKTVTSDLREKALDGYLAAVDQTGRRLERGAFKKDYYTFSAIFSLWMLLLIEKDLKNPPEKWPKECLLAQWDETLTALIQCAERLE